MNSRCLQLYRAYSISFNSSNVSNLFWSSILKDCIKLRKRKRELCCFVFLSSTKRAVKFFSYRKLQVLMFYRLGKKKRKKNLRDGGGGGDNHPHGRPRVKK